jgi:zinc/manganese transport system ATP-binding protein
MNPAGAPRTLQLENLTLGYERHPAIHHLTLTIPPGSLVGVVGPNGSGKSTLLKALAGQLRPMEGHLHGLAGQRVAYLPQQADIDRSFPIRVRDLVAMGLWHEVGALGGLGPNQRERCRQALQAVGLEGFGHRTIDTLSGGQFQRALFARLLLQDADLVLLDEPFAAIDTRTTDDLLALLESWHQAGKTVLVVLHDLQQVRAHCPQALLLARELVAWGPAAEVLAPVNLQRARRMTEAWDDDAGLCEAPVPAAGVTAPAGITAGPVS